MIRVVNLQEASEDLLLLQWISRWERSVALEQMGALALYPHEFPHFPKPWVTPPYKSPGISQTRLASLSIMMYISVVFNAVPPS